MLDTSREVLAIEDVARMFRRQIGTVNYWRAQGMLPPPDVTLGRTPGWYRETLALWGRQTGRLDEAGNPVPWGRGSR